MPVSRGEKKLHIFPEMCKAALWGPFHFNQMGGKLVFTAVSRWNYKSRQPLPPCRGRAQLPLSPKISSGPSSGNLGCFFSFLYIYPAHLPSLYSHIHQNAARPSAHRRHRLAHLFLRISNALCWSSSPTTGPSFGLFSPQQALRLQARPPPLNLHYDGYQGVWGLSVLNQRWQETKHGLLFFHACA